MSTENEENEEKREVVFKPPWGPNNEIKLPAEVARKNLWFKLTRVASKGYPLTIGEKASLEEMEAEWARVVEEREDVKHQQC